MVVFLSELINCGGAVPVGLRASTPRVIAFIALANYNLHYNNTVPISPPRSAYAKAQVPTAAEKCRRNGCRKKVAQPQPVWFMCQKEPLCQIHGTGTCSAYDATLTVPKPQLFEAPAHNSPLGSPSQGSLTSVRPNFVCTFAATCLMPLGNTGLMTHHLPQPPMPVTEQQPVDVP